MPKIVIEVMPKSELLDPQGKAVTSALTRKGYQEFLSVRVGKRFELAVAENQSLQDSLEKARKIAEDFLSNSVIEDVVSVELVQDEN